MNEGHAALLTLELLGEEAQKPDVNPFAVKILKKCAANVFSPRTLRFRRS
jgi:hypothetical protein